MSGNNSYIGQKHTFFHFAVTDILRLTQAELDYRYPKYNKFSSRSLFVHGDISTCKNRKDRAISDSALNYRAKPKFFGLDPFAGTPNDGFTYELDFNMLVGYPPHAIFRFQYRFSACSRFSQNTDDLLVAHSNFDLIIIYFIDLTASDESKYRKYAYCQHQQLYYGYNLFHLSLLTT